MSLSNETDFRNSKSVTTDLHTAERHLQILQQLNTVTHQPQVSARNLSTLPTVKVKVKVKSAI